MIHTSILHSGIGPQFPKENMLQNQTSNGSIHQNYKLFCRSRELDINLGDLLCQENWTFSHLQKFQTSFHPNAAKKWNTFLGLLDKMECKKVEHLQITLPLPLPKLRSNLPIRRRYLTMPFVGASSPNFASLEICLSCQSYAPFIKSKPPLFPYKFMTSMNFNF